MGGTDICALFSTSSLAESDPMPRSTNDPAEIKRLTDLSDVVERYLGKQVRLILNDGTSVEGVFDGFSAGNNGGAGGQWSYRGSIKIRTDGEEREVDYLDVADILPPGSN